VYNEFEKFITTLFFYDQTAFDKTAKVDSILTDWRNQLSDLIKNEVGYISCEEKKNKIINIYRTFKMWDFLWRRLSNTLILKMDEKDNGAEDDENFWEIEIPSLELSDSSVKENLRKVGFEVNSKMEFIRLFNQAKLCSSCKIKKLKAKYFNMCQYLETIRHLFREFNEFYIGKLEEERNKLASFTLFAKSSTSSCYSIATVKVMRFKGGGTYAFDYKSLTSVAEFVRLSSWIVNNHPTSKEKKMQQQMATTTSAAGNTKIVAPSAPTKTTTGKTKAEKKRHIDDNDDYNKIRGENLQNKTGAREQEKSCFNPPPPPAEEGPENNHDEEDVQTLSQHIDTTTVIARTHTTTNIYLCAPTMTAEEEHDGDNDEEQTMQTTSAAVTVLPTPVTTQPFPNNTNNINNSSTHGDKNINDIEETLPQQEGKVLHQQLNNDGGAKTINDDSDEFEYLLSVMSDEKLGQGSSKASIAMKVVETSSSDANDDGAFGWDDLLKDTTTNNKLVTDKTSEEEESSAEEIDEETRRLQQFVAENHRSSPVFIRLEKVTETS
jgi:hypothetical protein